MDTRRPLLIEEQPTAVFRVGSLIAFSQQEASIPSARGLSQISLQESRPASFERGLVSPLITDWP